MNRTVSKQRSEVIEAFINIEWLMNAVISQKYFGKAHAPFIFGFLYDVNCTFALKRNVLKKIAPDFTEIVRLNRLNNIRNYFAHCNQEVLKAGESEWKVLDPKDTEKKISFEDLYSEFMSNKGEVESSLANLYEKLGGVWEEEPM